MAKNKADLTLFFGTDFLKDHAGRIMTDPDFALVELVANCWDAGAEIIKIEVPEKIEGKISIEDNGTGMTRSEFLERWKTLSYRRIKKQGKLVVFPNGRTGKRIAYGRNGKGRHAMFCFADKYRVQTWRDGEKCIFEIHMKGGAYEVAFKNCIKEDPSIHGTKIETRLKKCFLSKEEVTKLIGSKFIADPSLKIFVNEEMVTPSKLEDLIKSFDVGTDYGKVKIYLYDTQKSGRTTLQSGIAWHVNNRLVGQHKWKMAHKSFIDGRKSEAKRYIFVIEADILEDSVEPDWSWFKDNDKFKHVFECVSNSIIDELQIIFSSKRGERKKRIITPLKEEIKKLPVGSRDKIGKFIDDVQKNCPSLTENDLSNLTLILISLEDSYSGYELLERLSKVGSSDLDRLSEILSEWTIKEAKTVLDELGVRLKLIEYLESIIETKSDELHHLQPIFEKGLWILGPKFDSAQFTSNKTIKTVIRNFFQKKMSEKIPKRPDFVILTDSTIGTYSTDAYDDEGEIKDLEEVIIVELKRGKSILTLKEFDQVRDYTVLLREKGHISKNTKIIAYLLGSSKKSSVEEWFTKDNTTRIIPLTYNVILRKAHARTFNLIEKIREIKKIEYEDDEIRKLMTPTLPSYFEENTLNQMAKED